MNNGLTAGEIDSKIRVLLLKWGNEHQRFYPWRNSEDPYIVLVSEFMLHRTQTNQVEPIFLNFVRLYPTLADYVRASRSEVVKLLKPLGLNWRITGMLNALDILWEKYSCVPSDYEKLIAIQGIGQYIAGATICFTTNKLFTIIDSNIVRVIGRIHGLDLRGEARRKKPIVQAIADSCDPLRPRNFYYALIDLAHQICRPKKPACQDCPLLKVPCKYNQMNNEIYSSEAEE
ncbi:MAG: DNA-binding protein [Chloroflexota bacterium]